MEHHELVIEIARDGTLRAETRGVKGKACLKYAELLEAIVGRLTSQELTAEFYEPETPVDVKPLVRNGAC